MLTDARTLQDGQQLTADVCIAGAGAAGITLARALAGSGVGVVLLESGGFERDEPTQALYEGSVVGQDYWALQTSRLRFFGGSTNHWTGWCRPLDRLDFEARPGMLGGWPLDFEELFPFYAMAQEDCELDRFEYRAKVWAERYQMRLVPLESEVWENIAWQFSPPTRFGQRYRKELVDSEDVHVVTYANLTQVALARAADRVESFQVRCLRGPSLSVSAKAYVLALGGLENPRVLLASNDVTKAGVGNGRDTVGRFFSDHPHSIVGQVMMSDQYDEVGYTGTHRLGEGTSVRFSWALTESARRTLKMPGISITLDPPVSDRESREIEAQGVGTLMEQLGARPGKSKLTLFLRAEQPPNPESRVKLAASRDALGMRRIALDWQVPKMLDGKVKEALRSLALTVGQTSIGRLLSFPHTDQKPKDAWPTLWGGHHHIGTTRMSEDPRYGVVDRNCKMHDIDNLYCAGSSVFSTAGYANPTLTICALARRLGEHLKERYS